MPDPTIVTKQPKTKDNDSVSDPFVHTARTVLETLLSPPEPSPNAPNSTPHFTPEQAAWIEGHMKRVRGEFLLKYLEEEARVRQQNASHVGTPSPSEGRGPLELLRLAVQRALGSGSETD